MALKILWNQFANSLRWGGIFLTLLGPSFAATTESRGTWNFPSPSGQTSSGYLIFTPAATTPPPPLLIFLHGAGYRGKDLSKLENAYIPKAIRDGRSFDALVLCPQVDSYWNGEQAAAFIRQALEKHRGQFDPDRVYLTGESAGGGGAWEGAKLVAGDLAAVVPIATTLGEESKAKALKDLPVWAFHNVNDPYQKAEKSRTQVKAVRNAGGRFVFLTEYLDTPGKMHKGIWPNAHRQAWETAYQDPALWDWLFRQRRGHPELANNPPPAPTLGTLTVNQP